MKTLRRALIAVLAIVVLAIVALNVWDRAGEGGEPSASLPGAGAGPRTTVAPKQEWVSVGGAPIPTAEVVPANQRDERCVEGRVVDVVTSKGIPDAGLRFWPSLQVNTDAEGRFGARALWDRMTLREVTADGYFPFGASSGGVEMVLTRGTCAAGLVVPLVPKVVRKGLVTDVDDKPVAGARITVATDDLPPAHAVSDAEGRFTFSARDGALVEARAEGFLPTVKTIDFSVGVTGALVLVLERGDGGVSAEGATISVKVETEGTRADFIGATVIAWRDTRQGPVEVARSELAPAQLELKVEGPGPWLLQARAGRRSSNLAETNGAPVTLRLGDAGKLRGRVQDEKGQPVTGFTLTLREKRGPIAEGEGENRHVLDARGEYALDDLQSGVFNVSVTALGFAPADSQEVRLGEGLDARADFVLRPGGAITGRVLDRKSKAPLAQAVVSLEGNGEDSVFGVSGTRTDEKGEFTLGGLRTGRRSLFFAAEAHHARLVSIEAESGKTGGPIEVLLTPLAPGETPRLELVGIGAVLQAKGDVLVITSVIAGGGAAEVGLVAGDAVVSIEGQLTSNLGFLGGVELIRGQEDTWVLMSVRRANGALSDVRVPRRVISPP